jgi:flagellar basal body rod protein FlgG
MIKGLYAAASAMLADVNRQGVLAHNIANMDTPGFKQVLISLNDFYETPVVHPPESATVPAGVPVPAMLPFSASPRLSYLGKLGLGVENDPEETDFADGGLQSTGQALDMAIQGLGFFRVETPSGERYTRDGRFQRDAAGQMVTVDGYRVLDANGQPIELPEDGILSVANDGTLFVNGEEVGRLGIAYFANPETDLVRDLPNAFAAAGTVLEQPPEGQAAGVVVQGFLEGANVNPGQLMTQMVQVTRHYEAAQQMVQNQDELLGRTIASLGRL